MELEEEKENGGKLRFYPTEAKPEECLVWWHRIMEGQSLTAHPPALGKPPAQNAFNASCQAMPFYTLILHINKQASTGSIT